MVRYLRFVFQVCCFQGERELYFTDSENQESALVTFLVVEYTYVPWKHTYDGEIIHWSSAKPECTDLVLEGERGGGICCKPPAAMMTQEVQCLSHSPGDGHCALQQGS